MKHLIDTSVLVRAYDASDPLHAKVTGVVGEIVASGHEIVLARQVIHEFYVVGSRPRENNGLGVGPHELVGAIESLLIRFRLLDDPADLLDRWVKLCTEHRVRGRPGHDARLATWMIGWRIPAIITLNPSDFRRDGEITVVVPVA